MSESYIVLETQFVPQCPGFPFADGPGLFFDNSFHPGLRLPNPDRPFGERKELATDWMRHTREVVTRAFIAIL